MKIAFVYSTDGNINFNTVGVKYRRYTSKQCAICVKVPDGDMGGSYKVKGIDFPLVHYVNKTLDCWILNPSDDVTPKEVAWENWEELL